MEFVLILLLVAIVFGICFLVDKAFTKAFRSQPQHQSGLSLRPSKRYGSMGAIIAFIGIAGILTGIHDENTPMIVGSCILVVCGIGLVTYYLSTGIFYDDDGFLSASFGKKQRLYRYADILQQQLYALQGGHFIIELHMADGSSVMVQTQTPGYQAFLNHAFACWCRQKGISPDSCDFHDPAENRWFPAVEVE